jgi:hypothetical protein
MKRTKSCKAGCHVATVSRLDTRLADIAIKLRRAAFNAARAVSASVGIPFVPPARKMIEHTPEPMHRNHTLSTETILAKSTSKRSAVLRTLDKQPKKSPKEAKPCACICTICGAVFKAKQGLERHRKRKNPCLRTNLTQKEMNNPLRCVYCNTISTTKSHLEAHYRICKIKNNKIHPNLVEAEQMLGVAEERMKENELFWEEERKILEETVNAQNVILEVMRKQLDFLMAQRQKNL